MVRISSGVNAGGILSAFLINLGFAIFEVVGGVITNSVAILSDAVHDFSDSISLGLAWYLERKSNQPGDVRYTYGYRRLSLLGALINAIFLIIGSLAILSEAIPRLFNPVHPNAEGMLVFAVIGILVNGAAFLRLRNGESLNIQVITWHFIEDVLGWIAVLVVSLVLLVKDIHILDPILSILITLYVLYQVGGKLKKTMELFLQAAPLNIDVAEVQEIIEKIEGVQGIHHTHVWSLDDQHHVLSTHVVVREDIDLDELEEVKKKIREGLSEYNFSHVTIEIEPGGIKDEFIHS